MVGKPVRVLLDASGFVAIAWMWIAIYQYFTRSGVWSIVDHALGGATTLPGHAAVLTTCLLIGWITVAAACWLVWRVFLRGRLSADFPVARLRRGHGA